MASSTTAAFVRAAYMGELEEVKRIIEAGIDNIDDYPEGSMTALICAASTDNYEITEYLLKSGADPNKHTDDRLTPLKTAASRGNVKIAELLLKAGADPNFERNGEVALTLACDEPVGQHNRRLIELLLTVTDPRYLQRAYEYCADPNVREQFRWHSTTLTDPNEFGGPKFRRHRHYDTPPSDPLARQCWEAMGAYVDTFSARDPNRAIWMSMLRCGISDGAPVAKISHADRSQLKRLFVGDRSTLAKLRSSDYAELCSFLDEQNSSDSSDV